MDTPARPEPATHATRPQIEAWIAKTAPNEAIEELGKMLENYGNITSIELLPFDSGNYMFLIDFEKPADAVAASLELNYLLFGHSTLVIQAPRNSTFPG